MIHPHLVPSLKILSFGWWFPPRRTPVDFHGIASFGPQEGVTLFCGDREIYVHEFGVLTATQHVRCKLGAEDIPEAYYKLFASAITNAYTSADSAFGAFVAENGDRPDVVVIGHCLGAGLSRVSLLAEALRDRLIVTSWSLLPKAIDQRYRSMGVRHVLRGKLLRHLLDAHPAVHLPPLCESVSSTAADL